MNNGAGQRGELADSIRRKHRKETQRQRMTLAIFITLGVLISAGSLIWLQLRPTEGDATEVVAPRNATEDYGFVLTPELVSDTVDPAATLVEVKVYEDFLCPSCQIFHEQSGDYLTEQVAAGNVQITYHPIAFLLSASTDEYSQRATNAAVCVADQAGVPAYAEMHSLLMQHQPAQGGPGLTDSQLVDFAAQAGAGDISECVADRTFGPWIEKALEEAKRVDITGTPTIRINGADVVRVQDGNETIPGQAELATAIEGKQ